MDVDTQQGADIVTFGPVEADVLRQIRACRVAAEAGAPAVLCADNHLGYSMPIGGVIAYRSHVSPSAVGYDIACGNMAARTPITFDDLRRDLPRLMDRIWTELSFGMGRKNAARVDAAVLEEIDRARDLVPADLAAKARAQLGTIGGGNHYVDLLADAEGFVWVGVHFGSRGFGHTAATWALQQAGARDTSVHAPPALLPLGTPAADAYLRLMELAGRYAYAAREWVVSKVLRDVLRTSSTFEVHNHHNFAWREEHGGESWFVHRKGATPAFPGQYGFIGGSMGGQAVIVRGIESGRSRAALYSTVHGAGRVLSRTQAAGRTKRRPVWQCGNRDCGATVPHDLVSPGKPTPRCQTCGGPTHKGQIEETMPGVIDWPAVQADLRTRGIELRGGGADEAPACYKDLRQVLEYHAGTIEIVHVLHPIGVAMAGRDEYDPYKD